MKKLKYLICMAVCLGLSLTFVACGKTKNPSNPPANNNVNTLNLSYMENLMVDTNQIAALGINLGEQETDDAEEPNEPEQPIQKYFLYQTSVNYENGSVEYDAGSIQKVTFKKNTSITTDVYDGDGNLIDSSKIISQDELDAQINRVLVTKNYTYMQFVIPVKESGDYSYSTPDGIKTEHLEIRPNALTFDENGISSFDKEHYYSSPLSQSFVIDNATGYIYRIEGINIYSIKNDLVVYGADGNYYRISLGENHELIFKDILPNKEVYIKDMCFDQQGYIYVVNSKIEQIDDENKIVYTKKDLIVSEDNRIFTFKNWLGGARIEKEIECGIEKEKDPNLTIWGVKQLYGNSYDEAYIVGCINGREVYQPDRNNDYIVYHLVKENYDIKTNAYWFDKETLLYWDSDTSMLGYYTLDYENLTETTLTPSSFTPIEVLEKYSGTYKKQIGENQITLKNVYKFVDATSTKYYQLVKENGEITLKLVENKVYEDNIYVLQPINK